MNQSCPLPRAFKEPIVKDMNDQGYIYGRECFVKVFLWETHSFLGATVSNTTSTRPMALADLFLKEPRPNLVSILKRTAFAGNPALVLAAYDGDLKSLSEKITLAQKREALSQVAQAFVFLALGTSPSSIGPIYPGDLVGCKMMEQI